MDNKVYQTAFKTVSGISIFIYAISLTQEGFCTVSRCGDNWTGLSIVALGAIGGILSVAGMAWYANPLLWASWWFLNKEPKKSVYFSAASTALALSFLFFTEISDMQPGKLSYITAYQAGYWLWVTSNIYTLIGSFALTYLKRKYPVEERYYPY
ncbi:hypothetical protein [Mucilaginibacter sp. HD30]